MKSRLAAITARMAFRFFSGMPRHQSLYRDWPPFPQLVAPPTLPFTPAKLKELTQRRRRRLKLQRSKRSRSPAERTSRLSVQSHHKASPLSEIEVANTRKPITKATDGTADSNIGYFGGGGDVVLWREEQLDSAEDLLRRTVEMWRQAAMRGDPDSPHGRVLREHRGENW